jgi:hypothetical protein
MELYPNSPLAEAFIEERAAVGSYRYVEAPISLD